MSLAEKRRLTPEDLYKLAFVSDPQISPDGTKIAFVKTTIDEKSKEYRSQIWVVPSDGSAKPRQFTSGPKSDTSPRWSPDGTRLAFVSDRNGEKQIYVIPTEGGEALQVTKMRRGAGNPVWAPDGTRIAFTASIDPEDKPEDYEKPLDQKTKEAEEKARKDEPTILTRLKIKSDAAMGLTGKRRSHIFVIDAAGKGPAIQLTSGEFDHSQPRWSPDGKYLAFSANRNEDADYEPWLSDIYLVPAGGGVLRKLTKTQGPSSSPVFTPDGKSIVYVGHRMEHGSATLTKLWKIALEGDPGGQEPVLLTSEFDRSIGDSMAGDVRFGGSPGGPRISPDGKTVYFLASDRGKTCLYRVSIDGGETELVLGGKRQVFGFTIDDSGKKVALAFSDPLLPGDIAVYDMSRGLEKVLTEVNKELLDQVYLSKPEERFFEAKDGLELFGWIMKPVGFKEGRKYPGILEVHGGPHSMYGWNFFFEFQLLASRGYVVFYTNPRGGEGFGQEFVKAVIGDYGGKDFDDLMTWVDAVLKEGFVDENNLGVTGGSYGGFMTNWIVGHTGRFKAAVTQRSISNWLSFYGVSDIGYTFTEREILGNPWNDTERLWRHSPLAYAENVTTPLLILHSENDMRCPIEQGEQFYVALKRMKKEVEMVRFPGSNHELSRSGKPVLRVARLNQILRWFDSHLERRSEDYEP